MGFTQEESDKIHWWHSMQLPGGVVTKGHHDPSSFFDVLRLPDLHGKTLADVGAWDGFFSFEAERRGAIVTAIDHHVWNPAPSDIAHGNLTGRQGFDFARGALGSAVEDIDCDIDSMDKLERKWDVVLFIGVLYHMRHPLLALEKAASITGDLCVIETHTDCLNVGKPAMAFYEGLEIGGDPTNWVGPNPAAVCAMARAAGFKTAEVIWTVTAGPVGRCVVHARKS